MEKWIFESLSNILGADLSQDLTQYILSVDNEDDFDDYMRNLFDFSVREQKELYENIKSAKFGKQNKFQNGKNKPKASLESAQTSGATPESAKKKTKKFRKFQLSELQKGYLKEGRNPCDCQATKHKLINNCLECGRIVCEQEGSGPCFFCDNMVCTKEELEILNSATKEGDALYRTLTDRKKSENWKKAIESRNKLLDFDKSSSQHTKIIDDEHDYFDVNNRWLTKQEREKTVQKFQAVQDSKHASRLGARKIVLDLLEKRAVEDTTFNPDFNEEEAIFQNDEHINVNRTYVPDIETLLQSLKLDKSNFQDQSHFGLEETDTGGHSRAVLDNYVIQDKALLEMSDKGMCLSMHQPWASLLVLGIKKHEGRTWYTPHRGPLWIASTNKPIDPDVIKQVESFYVEYYAGINVRFPDKYPTGYLLGNVLVQDCLPQDEYREQFSEGESESPYVFICSNPQKLIVPIPLKGEPKIYKLDTRIHTMARDALILKKRFAV